MAGEIPNRAQIERAQLERAQFEYDIPTAVTFLIAGLGLGSILTLLFASRFEKAMLIPRRDPTRHAVSLLYNKRFDTAC